MADNKFGRFKTVSFGLWLLLPSLLFLLASMALRLVASFVTMVPTMIFFYLSVAVFLLFLSLSKVIFESIIVQLGVDQLYSYPAEYQSVFIHWFVWIFYMAHFVTQIVWTLTLAPVSITTTDSQVLHVIGECDIAFLKLVFVILLVLSLFVAHCKKKWFHIEAGRLNPYKLVYTVTRFAWRHKVPIRRSAFTFCEDDIPSGLNLAKSKYGGPFTTEQVEDVKVFYGILKVLFALGPVFFLTFATEVLLYQFSLHGTVTQENYTDVTSAELVERIFIQSGILTPFVTCICIPLHLLLIRPIFQHYIPGMLKRMGLGVILTVLSLVCLLTVDIVAHAQYEDKGCMFHQSYSSISANNTAFGASNNTLPPPTHFYNTAIIVLPRILQSFSNMLIFIGLYEFICSQSPQP